MKKINNIKIEVSIKVSESSGYLENKTLFESGQVSSGTMTLDEIRSAILELNKSTRQRVLDSVNEAIQTEDEKEQEE